ncbi:hypothetical protein BGZ70_009625 [Mortierella alpina]|uniref:Uncharacterized protein n=1 Tax=Mortierella alpina TaxID=64518 RepID=A0A9P6M054_MORAP|nr:hypothetical protein BGZ70_009625 [Mortierella alpina]
MSNTPNRFTIVESSIFVKMSPTAPETTTGDHSAQRCIHNGRSLGYPVVGLNKVDTFKRCSNCKSSVAHVTTGQFYRSTQKGAMASENSGSYRSLPKNPALAVTMTQPSRGGYRQYPVLPWHQGYQLVGSSSLATPTKPTEPSSSDSQPGTSTGQLPGAGKS